MKYRKFAGLDWQGSALGFGCMRFPVIDGDTSRINEKPAAEMLLHAIDQGVNYIDTAYPYHGGTSESFVGKTLEGGYRDKVKLATKLPSWKIEKSEDFDLYLNEQLDRLRTDQIDFYLLHSLNEKLWKAIDELDVLSWVEKAKADGRIKNIGFSFHDEHPVFKSIVDAYDNWDFCLIQHNFMDVDYQAGKKGLLYAADKGMGVVIMEPLRGGRLIDPPQPVQEIWDRSAVKRSAAEWSLQWLWNQPEVSLVLSGMSTMQQVEENIASASRSGIGSLTSADLELVDQAKATYEGFQLIPCTSCGYCIPCPEGVDIPRILKIYNDGIMYDKVETAKNDYKMWVPEENKGNLCIVCGECEEKCPQDIPISDWMAKIHQEYIGKKLIVNSPLLSGSGGICGSNNTIRNKGYLMLVASDLNGTLTTGSPILAVARWVKKNQPESYPAGFVLGLFASYLQVKLGMEKIDTWGDINMRRVLKLVSKPTQEILDQIMDSVVEDELWLKKRDTAVDILNEYHQAGAKIIIISAAYEPAVQKFAAKIGLENTYGIGTELEFTESGLELVKRLTTREVKLEKIHALVGDQQIDIALGDTFADIPLLEEAAEAIAVFPDKTLRATALDRGWRIID